MSNRLESNLVELQQEIVELRKTIGLPVSRLPVQSSPKFAAPARDVASSAWTETPLAPPDPVFGVAMKYREDPRQEKVDLVVGAYRTNEGKPYLLPSVAKAEDMLAEMRVNKAYGPIDGLHEFTRASASLVLGADSPALKENRVALCQSLSGTGALALTANLYSRFLPIRTKILLSRPTWANHRQIFEFFGFRDIDEYRYWDPVKRGLDFEGMIQDLRDAPARSVVVLHLCAHNPTGCDPTLDQWRTIGRVIWECKHHVVFDSAYQGYATGDLERDAWPARLFEQELGLEFALTQSYSKNMGLYGERIGCFSYICRTATGAERIASQVRKIVRGLYSNPPIHGARVVLMLLNDKDLRAQWEKELLGMSQRIVQMRDSLRKSLEELGTPGTWSHVTGQIGMFSFTGLTRQQVDFAAKKYAVYMLPSGRVSMAGLTEKNVKYVAKAIDEAVRRFPADSKVLSNGGDVQSTERALALLEAPFAASRVQEFRFPSAMGSWAALQPASPDEIFGVQDVFTQDPNPNKVNLVVVADGNRIGGRTLLLPSVAEAERRLAQARLQKEYAPIEGDKNFCLNAAKLILGEDSPAIAGGRVAMCQSLSGTGALSIVASFFSRFLPIQSRVLFSDPTWVNHRQVFKNMGFLNLGTYRYLDRKTMGLNIDGMLEDLRAAPRKSVVVLQLCGHNPTGVDPTRAEWRKIAEVCKDRKHHIVLDSAYQGFASGDVDADGWAARMLEREFGLEFAITKSFSKPMGLYGERIGAFLYVLRSEHAAARILSQAKIIARRLYSNPPLHGARIVTSILTDEQLGQQWRKEVRAMSNRIRRLRGAFLAELEALGTPGPAGGDWSHLEKQQGMFSLTGLTRAQLAHLREKHHIYLPDNGRMSVPGLTAKTADSVASAFDDAIRTHPFPLSGRTITTTRTRQSSKM
eukprot:Hpha_TRINITY_DN12977_c0_g1::TRINITY_DN12977_c0_g1_i1::g.164313::m.164313/K14454/GOT1; aspartate aminotransferase, cytoplasmic